MPLRPEIRALYGVEWRAFRERFAATHPKICAKCGKTHPWMNLAHKRHEAGRRDPFAVEWLCPPCHGRNDTPQRIAATRRRFAKRDGQLWLLPEIEFAPFALWEIPDDAIAEVLEALQEELFTP